MLEVIQKNQFTVLPQPPQPDLVVSECPSVTIGGPSEDDRFINLKVNLAVDEFLGARDGMGYNWDCTEQSVEMACMYLTLNLLAPTTVGTRINP